MGFFESPRLLRELDISGSENLKGVVSLQVNDSVFLRRRISTTMNKDKSNDIFNDLDIPISIIRKNTFQGTGVDLEDAVKKPIIAIASSQTDINPGHMHLSQLAARVKEGVLENGGIPFEFNVPAPCDGMTEGHEGMRYVLAQRDLIADIIETHVRSMRYDAVVFIATCDKIIPGMLMAAARLDLPAIFLTGGPNALKIRFHAAMQRSISFRDYPDLNDALATTTCATCGACEVMGTANTMQCITEALGMALPGSANVPAFLSEKLVYARKTGRRIMDLVGNGVTARQIMDMKALENALMVSLAVGGSTNATLHLPAIAQACGQELPLMSFNVYNKKIPTLCGISPNGPHGAVDLYTAGGVPAVMKRIRTDLHLDARSVSGQTIDAITDQAKILDETVIMSKEKPFFPEGSTAVLFGNLAPDGAVVKQAAVAKEMRCFTGRARIFESEADCLKAFRESAIEEGNVVVIRNEGPKGGPGMPETLAVTLALMASPLKNVALITDGRFSGGTSGPCIGHVSPEAAAGGAIAILRDGDVITINIPERKLDVALSDAEIKSRLKAWQRIVREIPDGYMRRYVKYVTSAARGAVLE